MESEDLLLRAENGVPQNACTRRWQHSHTHEFSAATVGPSSVVLGSVK